MMSAKRGGVAAAPARAIQATPRVPRVQITPPALPHLVFYETLAALDESHPLWEETVAGLLALRLYDTWCERSALGESLEPWEIAGVTSQVETLPAARTVRAPLRALVRAAESADQTPTAALSHLAAYARALHFGAHWLLAADVFTTILGRARGAPGEVLFTAAFHRGYCYRMAGMLDHAAASYNEGRLIAVSCDNEAGVLEADFSHAKLALHRGNLPAAEALLDSVIASADAPACRHVLARALHDRGQVAARRGRPDDAVTYVYRAYALYESESDRDRALGDVAGALAEAGYHDAAWDARLVIQATAQEQETRWSATVNLIELAAWRGDRRLFEQFIRELDGVALPPWLAGYYHLHAGAGYHQFGEQTAAGRALREAVAVAVRHELHEVRMKADDLLTAVERSPSPVVPAPAPSAGPVADVITAVRALREQSAVATV